MQLDSPIRKVQKWQRQIQKCKESAVRRQDACRLGKLMSENIKSLDDLLQKIEVRIQSEVEKRISEFLEGDAMRAIVEERIAEVLGTSASSSSSAASSASEVSSTCTELPCSSASPAPLDEPELQEPSCSSSSSDAQIPPPVSHYPNKWEFISTLTHGEVTDFRLEHFTQPVKTALKLTSDAELFPRMSLEEMIEQDHPTTSDSGLFDQKLISCRNRPQGKDLTDEEFFCLAPCCSASRLYQAASCPFLPSFVKKRLTTADDCKVFVQRRADGIELITPIRWQSTKPIVPEPGPSLVMPEIKDQDEEKEEEDPLGDRDAVEMLMREFFIPTPELPLDELIFGPYLRKVRQSNVVPCDLLRSLVRRVNSNLENSFENHQELELFAELDKVEVDEKYGRLPFDPANNC